MKKIFLVLIFVSLFFCNEVQAVDLGTTGFIPGSIWYSKDPLVEGDTVKVYTALWNNSETSLSAKIEFYDKNVILGTRDIVVPASSLKEVYISWKVTSGDHLISAKIISPSITASGKKQVVMLDNITTSVSKKFVPVVINTIEGTPATSSDIIKSQIDKATSSLDNILPTSISEPMTENAGVVDSFRIDTLKKIEDTKTLAKTTIEAIKKVEDAASSLNSNTSTGNQDKAIKEKTTLVKNNNMGIEEATEKPIAYLKLFFFSVLSFIFGSKIVFYLLLLFIVFFVLRSIYRRIRNR